MWTKAWTRILLGVSVGLEKACLVCFGWERRGGHGTFMFPLPGMQLLSTYQADVQGAAWPNAPSGALEHPPAEPPMHGYESGYECEEYGCQPCATTLHRIHRQLQQSSHTIYAAAPIPYCLFHTLTATSRPEATHEASQT